MLNNIFTIASQIAHVKHFKAPKSINYLFNFCISIIQSINLIRAFNDFKAETRQSLHT